jgi:cyclopropane-fatty-acyl-phospholipid synthase
MTSAQALGHLKKLLKDVKDASFRIRLWDGTEETVGTAPTFTLVFRDEATFAELMRSPDAYHFAVAYCEDRFDVEGDLYGMLRLKQVLKTVDAPWKTKLAVLLSVGFSGLHSRKGDKRNIQAHYDVSNDFYKLFLDTRIMAYSCAYFHSSSDSLEDAQEHKVDLVCRKLRLKPGERLLDIGCGWGGLLIHAAKHYGVTGVGVTLSQNQYDLAREYVAAAGLQDKITIELRDYRDLEDASFDKISSIGMVEHVGIRNYPKYFGAAHRLLKDGGLFLNHGITGDPNHKDAGEGKFLRTRIFPNAEMDSISHMETVAEAAGFEIVNVESLRPHYALTLRAWEKRLVDGWDRAVAATSKETCRTWRIYFAGCAVAFEDGTASVFQTLLQKAPLGEWSVPLTPHDVYSLAPWNS